MKAKLYWQETMYGDDFECSVKPPKWMWDANDSDDCVWTSLNLKAYDIELQESGEEKDLFRLGYKYKCEIGLNRYSNETVGLASRAVRNREEAERFFRDYIEQLEETK